MPRKPYIAADGGRLPGCTTLTGHLDGSPEGLLSWANKGGLEGKTLAQLRGAADVGTWVHEAIEADLRGVEYGWPTEATGPQIKHCDAAFSAWLRWREQNKPEVLSTELSLVSERHRFGGTLDAVLRINGRVCLVDFKTGKLYPKHLAQVAGYGILWLENKGAALDEYHLLRLGKEDGALHWSSWVDAVFEPPREAFLAARRAYECAHALKKMSA